MYRSPPLRRPDPFFATRKPHGNGYLESLHRTYGEPAGALPGRNDEQYKRALEFRTREKAHYADLERKNQEISRKYDALFTETERIRALFEQLSSKVEANGHADAGRGDGDRSVPADEADDAEARGDGRSGGVPEPVLRPEGDVRRHAEEHAAEGPEPGDGAEPAAQSAGPDGGAGEDPK